MALPARKRHGAAILSAAILHAALLTAAGPALAAWSFRGQGNYQSARYGQAQSENSYFDLLARQSVVFGSAHTLNLALRLRRDDDLGAERHMLTGQVTGDLSMGTLALYLRHRPDQRPALSVPAEWRREDTILGGSLLLPRMPELHYEEIRRDRNEPGAGKRSVSGADRRVRTAWSFSGVGVDYSYRRAENTTTTLLATEPESRSHRVSADHTGGIDWSATLRPGLSASTLWRASSGRVDRTGARRQHSRYQRAETGVHYRPWLPVTVSGSASWQNTQTRLAGDSWRDGRTLDFTGNLSMRPLRQLEFVATRAYQEQASSGQPRTSVDYALALLRASGRACPELLLNAAASRTWTLSNTGATPPANQASLGATGILRPGIEVTHNLTGQALEGVSADLRYQVSQSTELRLRPSRVFGVVTSLHTQRLGERITLRRPDRTQVRLEGLYTGESGGSASMAWTTQRLRDVSASTRYTLTGNASLPWRRIALTLNGQASRSAGIVDDEGRPWGFATSLGVRSRLRRLTEVTCSFTRTLPAIGSGSSIWQASIQQRLQ